MRMAACEDAAAPRLHTPPPLPSFCTTTPRVNPYLPDTLASSRVPCCCLETTPTAALAVDPSHGQQTRVIDPVAHLVRPDPPEDHHDALHAIAISPCPFGACTATHTVRPVNHLGTHDEPIKGAPPRAN